VDWVQRRFKIESPTHFLVAAGDFAAIAARMRPMTELRRRNHTTTGPQIARWWLGASAQKVRKEVGML
jgi:hypothetical protein